MAAADQQRPSFAGGRGSQRRPPLLGGERCRDSGTGVVNSICGLLIADASYSDRSPATTHLGSPTAIALSKDRGSVGWP